MTLEIFKLEDRILFEAAAAADIVAALDGQAEANAENDADNDADEQEDTPIMPPDNGKQEENDDDSDSIFPQAPDDGGEDTPSSNAILEQIKAENFSYTNPITVTQNEAETAGYAVVPEYEQPMSEIDEETLAPENNGEPESILDDTNDTEEPQNIEDDIEVENTETAEDTTNSLVVINSTVKDQMTIISQLDDSQEILVIAPESDPIDQIIHYLEQHEDTDYGSLHIVSHGNEGYISLNGQIIDADAVENDSRWEIIGNSLTEDGDILLYACNTAAGQDGQDFAAALARITGADVAASVDSTGLDGWGLEYSHGSVEAAPLDISGYSHSLESYTVSSDLDDGAEGSLRYGLETEHAGEILFADPATPYNIQLRDVLTVTNDVTIYGGLQDISITAADGKDVFDFSGDTITIEGISFIGNAYSTGATSGGNGLSSLITLSGSQTLNLTNSSVTEFDGTVIISAGDTNSHAFINFSNVSINGNNGTVIDASGTNISITGDFINSQDYAGYTTSFVNNSNRIINLVDSTLNLNTVSFQNNASKQGSLIHAVDSSINTVNSLFANNSAEYNGDSDISAQGGVIYALDSTVSIQNSIFRYNYADNGSAVFSTGSTVMEIQDSLFAFNGQKSQFARQESTTTETIYSDARSLVVINSTFTENSGERASAIYIGDATAAALIVNCTFAGNTATQADAPAVYTGTSNTSIVNSIFANSLNTVAKANIDVSGTGGATVYNSIYQSITSSNITINDSKVIGQDYTMEQVFSQLSSNTPVLNEDGTFHTTHAIQGVGVLAGVTDKGNLVFMDAQGNWKLPGSNDIVDAKTVTQFNYDKLGNRRDTIHSAPGSFQSLYASIEAHIDGTIVYNGSSLSLSDHVTVDAVFNDSNNGTLSLRYSLDGTNWQNTLDELNIKDAGTYSIHVEAASDTSSDFAEYSTFNITINPRTLLLTADGFTIAPKEYDGTTNVTDAMNATYTFAQGQLVENDTASITWSNAVLDSKDAATVSNVSFSDFDISNANYSISNTEPIVLVQAGLITAKVLTIDATQFTIKSKTYDGKTNAGTNSHNNFAGQLVGDDTVTLTYTATLDSANVADVTKATFSDFSIDNSNYILNTTSLDVEQAGLITPREITIDAARFTINTKTYDGNTDVLKAKYDFQDDLIGDDTANLAWTAAVLDSANVTDVTKATFSGFNIDNSNYSLNTTSLDVTRAGLITPKPIILEADNFTIGTKVYDMTTEVTQNMNPTYTFNNDDFIQGDSGELTWNAAINSPNVAEANGVNFTNITISNSNYIIANENAAVFVNKAGIVTPRNITVDTGRFTIQSKVYDGTTSVTQEMNLAYAFADGDIIEGDTVNISWSHAALDSKDVDTVSKAVINGITFGNGNYTPSVSSIEITQAGLIAPRTLNVTAEDFTFHAKVYDSNTNVTDDMNLSHRFSNEIIGNDTVSLAWSSAALNSKNVAEATSIILTGLSLNNSNYAADKADITLTGQNLITPKTVIVKASNKTKTYGSEDPDFTYTVEGLIYGIEGELLNLTLDRVAGEDVNQYAINIATNNNPNYILTPENFTPGTLTIKPLAAAIIWDFSEYVQNENLPVASFTMADGTEQMLPVLSATNNQDITFYIADNIIASFGNYSLSNTSTVYADTPITISEDIQMQESITSDDNISFNNANASIGGIFTSENLQVGSGTDLNTGNGSITADTLNAINATVTSGTLATSGNLTLSNSTLNQEHNHADSSINSGGSISVGSSTINGDGNTSIAANNNITLNNNAAINNAASILADSLTVNNSSIINTQNISTQNNIEINQSNINIESTEGMSGINVNNGHFTISNSNVNVAGGNSTTSQNGGSAISIANGTLDISNSNVTLLGGGAGTLNLDGGNAISSTQIFISGNSTSVTVIAGGGDICLNGGTAITADDIYLTGGMLQVLGGGCANGGVGIAVTNLYVSGGTLEVVGGVGTNSTGQAVSISADGSVNIQGTPELRSGGTSYETSTDYTGNPDAFVASLATSSYVFINYPQQPTPPPAQEPVQDNNPLSYAHVFGDVDFTSGQRQDARTEFDDAFSDWLATPSEELTENTLIPDAIDDFLASDTASFQEMDTVLKLMEIASKQNISAQQVMDFIGESANSLSDDAFLNDLHSLFNVFADGEVTQNEISNIDNIKASSGENITASLQALGFNVTMEDVRDNKLPDSLGNFLMEVTNTIPKEQIDKLIKTKAAPVP